MFTGIIRQIGETREARQTAGGKRLTIDLGTLAEHLRVSDSLAVSGACLTATAIRGCQADFDVVAETLRRTTLGSLQVGSKVNLELPLRVGDRLDGHLVQGHVDGVASVRAIRAAGEHLVELVAQPELTSQMAPKGSVCLDGVSLTLVDVGQGAFSVALIPTTLAQTTLGELAVGAKLNVETDVIGKYVRRYLQQMAGASQATVTLEKLKEAGFA